MAINNYLPNNKEFADDNFKFDENGRKLSTWVENTVGNGEIACYKQFLHSHSVFKRLVSQGRQKVSLCGNGLNSFSFTHIFLYTLIHESHDIQSFTTQF